MTASLRGVCVLNLTNFTPFSSLQMISKRGQSVRKYGWHGTAPRGRCEKVKNENSIICLVIVINIIVLLAPSGAPSTLSVSLLTFQLKILASSHGPSCEWSQCLPEVFPGATHWWFRQTCTAGSEDRVLCVCFADFFVFLCYWQISSQQDQISQEHILRVHISSNSSGCITFERCSDNFDKSAWVWFHHRDGCHLSSENIPNVCDIFTKAVVFCPSCVALDFKDEIPFPSFGQ